jgi:hypothetical protein
MNKNKIQFQKGISLKEFYNRFGTEEQCRQFLFSSRWPDGFECVDCGWRHYCEIKSRKVYQCTHCRHQTSLISGTIFQDTKLSLTVWFLAIHLLTQSKNGISSLELARHLGVTQSSAWSIKHKLMQVMLERDNEKPLSGRIEMDDSYWGGRRHGGKRGRGAPGKTPFIAAVATSADRKPLRAIFSKVKGFRKPVVKKWGQKHLKQGSRVVSDSLSCFTAVEQAGCSHQSTVTGGGPGSEKHKAFHWVNTVLGNVKNSLHGTYHAVREKHLPRYLAEFHYRFNRRYELEKMIPRFIYIAVRTPAMPLRLLTMAEIPI